jgi:phosphatidylserine/phosphatidylglycerophosphate/cardiolipin synthase-like enzyme
MYRFTHGDPARVLVARKAAGVHTRLVLDQGFNKELCGALRLLLKNGIELFSCEKGADGEPDKFMNMHHKFLLFKKNTFGKPLLITGSCNYTYQGFFKNHEDYYVIDDEKAIEKCKAQYKRVRSLSRPIALAECSSSKDTDPKADYSRRNNKVLGL